MRSERRCLSFDFDGVLVDSNAVKREAYFSIFAGVDGSRQAVEAACRALPAGDRFDMKTRKATRRGDEWRPLQGVRPPSP